MPFSEAYIYEMSMKMSIPVVQSGFESNGVGHYRDVLT